MKNNTRKIVLAALLAAITCVATMIIRIPTPMQGYLNMGDCIVLLCGWILGPAYGFLAAAIGSALADILAGYMVYAIATFIIKGLMAVAAYYIFKMLAKGTNAVLSRIISAVAAEIIMILGYFLFEGFMYGFAGSLMNIPANGLQGLFGIIVGTVLIGLFSRKKLI